MKLKLLIGKSYWKIRRLKKATHMLRYSYLLSRPNIEINTISEQIIKKGLIKRKKNAIRAKFKKTKNKKQAYITVVSIF